MTTDTDTVSVAKPSSKIKREVLRTDTRNLMKILKSKDKEDSCGEALKNFVIGD
jgi:hypothetical protein